MKIAAALFCGVLFGAGLMISDMSNPARVLAFLDVAGAWDPSLLFVMVAALVPSMLGYRYARRRQRTVFDEALQIPPATPIDVQLVGGAAIFGLGWGLVGLCPGPAIADLTTLDPRLFVFLAAMLAGMGVHRLWRSRRQ